MAGGSGTVFSTFGAKDHLGGRSTAHTRYEGTKVQQYCTRTSIPYWPCTESMELIPNPRDTPTHTTQPIRFASECRHSDRNQGSLAVRHTRFGQDWKGGREGEGRGGEGRGGRREVEEGG